MIRSRNRLVLILFAVVEFLPGELKSRLLQIREFDDELHSMYVAISL